MDMSFANQALSAEFVVKNGKKLEKKVYPVPEEIDREIARLKLKSMSVRIDKLTPKQEKYLASWEEDVEKRHARLASVVYGIVQGLAEFLPISSSGHLALVPWLLGWRSRDSRSTWRSIGARCAVAGHLLEGLDPADLGGAVRPRGGSGPAPVLGAGDLRHSGRRRGQAARQVGGSELAGAVCSLPHHGRPGVDPLVRGSGGEQVPHACDMTLGRAFSIGVRAGGRSGAGVSRSPGFPHKNNHTYHLVDDYVVTRASDGVPGSSSSHSTSR